MTLLIYDDDSNVFLVYEMLFVKFIYELYFFYSLVCLSTVAIVFLLSGTLLLVCCIYLVFVLLHLSVILVCCISFGLLHLFVILVCCISFGLLHLFGFCSTAFVCYIVLLHLFWSAASI
jgi:hypothetical protein